MHDNAFSPGHSTLRRAAPFLLLALAALLGAWLVQAVVAHWDVQPGLRQAMRDGLICAGATALGALPVLAIGRIPQRLADCLMGFGAGVMLAATAFSLIVPGLQAAREQHFDGVGAGLVISVGICLGVAMMLLMDRAVPHAHLDQEGHTTRSVAGQLAEWLPPRVMLFVLAITLHNIPEGMAVGVASGSGMANAEPFSMAIALQDIPEGLVIALSLATAGVRRSRAVLIGVLSGLVEPVGALVAALAVGAFSTLLPWGLAFAAGAMLFAVSHEVIPESHRNGHETSATIGLTLGFCLMMVMDTGLG
ncbi:ZIP family metal transporter [Pseudoxanthomonas sp.]|uniref:ZIP family metal transporter n=1 Tax=Pseudoxanthomonas sp. TaxID=1871049 RepID=UPI002631D537|nr:ZIP family metal transporter [Pseudoxanthomonas sp.]WDS35087.1 MAG: ZIP family metal transporter [Pseudoxanthomonas sp.]